MRNIVNKIYQNNTILYKVLLFLMTTFAIVYLFPKGGQFKYEFNNGKVWKYDNLYATFDFAIQKTEAEILLEKEAIIDNSKYYFLKNAAIAQEVFANFQDRFAPLLENDSLPEAVLLSFKQKAATIIQKVYANGFLEVTSEGMIPEKNMMVVLKNNNQIEDVAYKTFLTSNHVFAEIKKELEGNQNNDVKNNVLNILSEIIKPNISFDADFTEKMLAADLKAISYTKGKVSKGKLIILKGDIVEGENLAILNSLKSEFESKVWTESYYNWIVLGYTILVSLALLMLLLFLYKYRIEIYKNNNKVTFIFLNVFLMIFIQTLVIKYNSDYLYVVPLSILPIVLKAFFDARLGLFTHVLTILLLGFIVPNSFEFIYLHIIAGIVTILTVSELYKRANLFISVGQITLIYMVTYFAFSIIKEGDTSQINQFYFMMFAANGVLSFLSIFFIYIYEKIFGLVSDN